MNWAKRFTATRMTWPRVKFAIIILIVSVLTLAGCERDCKGKNYHAYSLEIFSQQIATTDNRLPDELKKFIQPIPSRYKSAENRCFCPTNGIDLESSIPYVTILRIDSASTPEPTRILLVAGGSEFITYREFEEGINPVLDSLVLPMEFLEGNRSILGREVERKMQGMDLIFLLDTRGQPLEVSSIDIAGQTYKIYQDSKQIRDEIIRQVPHYYTKEATQASDEPYEFSPKIALFYDLDWGTIVRSMKDKARFKVSTIRATVEEELHFEDVSNPSTLMLGGTWDFGDGAISPYVSHTTHAYSKEGRYEVKFCSQGYANCDSQTVWIERKPPPTEPCKFQVNMVCPKQKVGLCENVKFVDVTQTEEGCIFARQWRINGNDVEGEVVMEHKFSSPDTYTVQFCVNIDSCTACTIIVKEEKPERIMQIYFKDSIIFWSPIDTSIRYQVSISSFHNPAHIIYESELQQTWLQVPKRIHTGDICRFRVKALHCNYIVAQGERAFNMISLYGKEVFDPICEVQK
jgi:hypothetical protein